MVKKIIAAYYIKDAIDISSETEICLKGHYIKKDHFFNVIRNGIEKEIIPITYVIVEGGDDYISSTSPEVEIEINKENRIEYWED